MPVLSRFLLTACLLIASTLGAWPTPALAASSLVRTDQVTARLLVHAPQGVLGNDGGGTASLGAPASPSGFTLPGTPAAPAMDMAPAPNSEAATAAASAAASAQAASPVWLGLALQHAPGWHTYWKNPGDSGLPTSLTWTLPPGVEADDIDWPAPEKIFVGDLANYGYEGEVLLPIRLRFTPDFRPNGQASLPVALTATWLVCKQECIPQTGEFKLDVPLRSSTALDGARFEAAWAARPQALSTDGQQLTLSDDGQRLHLRLADLPASWRGQPLELISETPNVVVNAARLASGRPADASLTHRQWAQAWDGTAWTASVPVSDLRGDSPAHMAWVVTHGDQAWRAELPVSGSWPAVAPPAEVSPALQAALAANAQAPATSEATRAPLTNWLLALGGALLGGLLLNLMPCVFPVLAIKLLGFAQTDDRARTRASGAGYVLGVVATCLALGGVMLALRAAGQQLGWGFQLQSPWMVAGLATLFTLIALNLFGLFEVPGLRTQAMPTQLRAHPLLDNVYAGVLAVVVASPCTAPFMGASIGLAIGLPAWQALGIFAALGVGMALPVIAAMLFPGVGRWLPRSGSWMQHFRQFLAFPMLATVVWLLWVLGQQVGLDGLIAFLAVLVALSLALWTLRLRTRRAWLATVAGVLVLAWTLHWAWPQLQATPGPVAAEAADTGTATASDWQPWSAEAVTRTVAAGQAVFVDYTAAWCVTCQFNKKTTLSDPAVLADFARRGVRLMRADWTRQDPAISAALQALGRSGVPVYVLHAPGQTPRVFTEVLRAGELHAALAQLPMNPSR
ncbi:protein-disulfide reductase DsbD family protein [Comamonas serinivorans]|nr:protein-disulfide reductase DsbD domain-containing protein [Comamonas serinivorans]